MADAERPGGGAATAPAADDSKVAQASASPDGGTGTDAVAGAADGAASATGDGAAPDAEGAPGQQAPGDGPKKAGILSRFKIADQPAAATTKEGTPSARKKTIIGPEDIPRTWQMSMAVRGLTSVGKDDRIDCFFAVCVRPCDPKNHLNHVQLLREYTPAYVLRKELSLILETPVVLYDKRIFTVSYGELRKHDLRVDMWRVNCCSFNNYHGIGKKNLWEIATTDPNLQVRLSKKYITKEEIENRKRKKPPGDVGLFQCFCSLEEIFDFNLAAENWNLELEPKHSKYKDRMTECKTLTFVMPKTWRSVASSGKGTQRRMQWTTPGAEAFTWEHLDPFTFIGTRTELVNQFFIVKVQSGKRISKRVDPIPTTIGRALMGLTSVIEISVFKGVVKDLTMVEENFTVGKIGGSIKCKMVSRGSSLQKGVATGTSGVVRPEQKIGASQIMNLRNMQYLVVNVKKCDNLATGDYETGTSNPFLRCSWDNMVQKSPIIKGSLRPIFNFQVYFPVRLFNKKVMDRKYQETALKYELESKGSIVISVWHHDEHSSDCLGNVTVSMSALLSSNHFEKMTMTGPLKKDEGEAENELAPEKKRQWYETPFECRVLREKKAELTGCNIPNAATPTIEFFTYFYYDFDEEVRLKPHDEGKKGEDFWKKRERLFDKANTEFQLLYAAPFPDAIGAKKVKEDIYGSRNEALRRFPCIGSHPQTTEMVPLMAYLTRIITPEEYSFPAMLLHWVNCIMFEKSSQYKRTGLIPHTSWKDPQTLMFTRKGPAQDHAILLCSVLLGKKKDAFVVKGTMWVSNWEEPVAQDAAEIEDMQAQEKSRPPKLVEHVWVMTREDDGYVTFWEPCTRELYHLPGRHTQQKSKKGKKKRGHSTALDATGDEAEAEEQEEAEQKKDEATIETEVADAKVTPDEMELLPTIGRMPRPKAKVKSKASAGREALKKERQKMRSRLPYAPNKKLVEFDDRLVDWLPYDSIDVVFNEENLWANHQNHHPACIMYDFGTPKAAPKDDAYVPWLPLLTEEDEKISWTKVCKEVQMEPQQRLDVVRKLEESMRNEMEENMRLYRGKRGNDTFFVRDEEMMKQLTQFLTIHEDLRKLDIDFCPIFKKEPPLKDEEEFIVEQLQFGRCGHRGSWNRLGHPFNKTEYARGQDEEWSKLLKTAREFLAIVKTKFPTKRGKVFSGHPVHFSTADKSKIREYLMQYTQYLKLLKMSQEGIFFTVQCKMFPLLGSIQSTWLYFGVQQPTKVEGDHNAG